MDSSDRKPVSDIAERLTAGNSTLSVAESCTGGLIGSILTSVPGSSGWFRGGIIAYSDSIKTGILGVDGELLSRCGSVSDEVVREMAAAACRLFHTDYSIAVSGVAGPGGGSCGKPVGTVWISVCGCGDCRSGRYLFSGDREAVRYSAALQALRMLLDMIPDRET